MDVIAQGPGSRCTVDCHKPTPAQCHCSVCHNTFGTVSSFDKHRKDGQCINPGGLNLTPDANLIWRFPSDARMQAIKDEYQESKA